MIGNALKTIGLPQSGRSVGPGAMHRADFTS
jgi:hypothetical protein